MPSEDFDAAPGFEVFVRDAKAITSWCLDHYNNVIWTGECSLQRSQPRPYDTCFYAVSASFCRDMIHVYKL